MLKISLKETIRFLRQKDYEILASLLEDTWESHPDKDHKHYDMWREQLAVNIPVLYIASIILHNYVQSHGIKNILFATRDCSHWYKIYKAMYPHESCHYFSCSRNMFNIARTKSRPYYEKYIKSLTDGDISNSIYVDVHGTGKRMYQYFKDKHDEIPFCFILSSGHSSSDGLSKEIRKLVSKDRAEFLVFSADGSPIEMLNYDIIGTCSDYNKYGPVRNTLEYDADDVQGYHNCVDRFIKLLKRKDSVDDNHTDKSMHNIIKLLFKPALNKLPVISEWIKPERKHDTSSVN